MNGNEPNQCEQTGQRRHPGLGAMAMSKWISGKELLEQRNLKDIELFQDYVAQGLQPYDDLGQPVSPSDVLEQIFDVKTLEEELAEHERASRRPVGEDEALFRVDRTFVLGTEREHAKNALKAAEGVSWTAFELPSNPQQAKALLDRLSECLFRRDDVRQVEKELSPLAAAKAEKPSKKSATPRKLRPNQRHKISCRAEAKKLWKEDPSITIADMIRRDELNTVCEGRVYTDKAMREWIKDLCPDRSGGRRPKKKTS